jgi:hypothetical protein
MCARTLLRSPTAAASVVPIAGVSARAEAGRHRGFRAAEPGITRSFPLAQTAVLRARRCATHGAAADSPMEPMPGPRAMARLARPRRIPMLARPGAVRRCFVPAAEPVSRRHPARAASRTPGRSAPVADERRV